MRLNLASGLVFLGVALLVCRAAIEMSLGSLRAPEPGLYPLLLGVTLAVLAVLLCASALRPAGGAASPARSPHGKAVATTIVTLLAYTALLPTVGFGPSTFLVLGALFRLGGMRWLGAALLSLAFTGGTMAGAVLLGIALPLGALVPWS